MIRSEQQLRTSRTPNAKGGAGEFINHHILEPEEMCGSGRLFAKCCLAPGHSVGMHTHTGEMEICHFISGYGTVLSDGNSCAVAPGDTNIVYSGQNHSVVNSGKENLIYLAAILYTK